MFKEIYKLGARKILIFNTPYIGCFPLARTVAGGIHRKCGDKFNEEAESFNIMLNRQIQYLNSTLPEARFIVIDYFKIVQDIIENYQQYGMCILDSLLCITITTTTNI